MIDFLTLLQVLDSSLRLATPLLLVCLAGLFSERAGIFDIGLEGKLLAAAFVSAAFAAITGSVWLGLLAGILASIMLSLLHGLASITLRGDQIISGVAINFLAAGLTVVIAQDLFGQGPVGNVGNIFTNSFQPPSDLPLGPYINLTTIPSDASEAVTDCVANYIKSETGMSYEQAYMDFAYTLGVRWLEDPDFYYHAVVDCMHLSYDKLLSGAWGIDGDYFTENPPLGDLDDLIDNCIVPHLSNALNIPREIILDDIEIVQSGKRSVTREEMLAAYDCWITHDGRYNNNFQEPPQNGGGYETLDIGLLFETIYGGEEIPGQNCMLCLLYTSPSPRDRG